MRIVVSEFVSLDGIMEAPEQWVFRFAEQEIDAFKLDEVLEASALLLGAATYQGFAESWPSRSDPDGFADKMNSMPKYVVSATSEQLAWNNSHQVKGDIAEEIARLKQQPSTLRRRNIHDKIGGNSEREELIDAKASSSSRAQRKRAGRITANH